MKSLLLIFASIGLVATADAQFSVSSGVGDNIPAVGTGDPAGWDDVNNADYDLTIAPFGTATVNVPVAVTSIDSIVVDGLTHTWSGDTMGVLFDPNGVGHLIWLRPEIEVGEACCGNSGDFLGGTYTFVEAGTMGSMGPLPEAGDIVAGTWDQTFDSGDSVNPVTWPSGEEMVNNTPLSMITGPAGNWTLNIYDFAAGDTGSFTDFTLNGNGGGGGGLGMPFCSPMDVNSTGNSTTLTAAGGTGVETGVRLDVTGGVPMEFGYFLIGTAVDDPGIVISNGRLCLSVTGGNQFGRYNFGTTTNSIGAFDAAGDFQNLLGTATSNGGYGYDIAVTNPLGGTIASGSTWHFQLWHRDTPAGAGSSNFSNGLSITFP